MLDSMIVLEQYNMKQNMEFEEFAKEILTKENYAKYIKSYNFINYFELFGALFIFLINFIYFVVILSGNIFYMLFSLSLGIISTEYLFLPIALYMPQAKIYKNFHQWYCNKHATLEELDEIFNK